MPREYNSVADHCCIAALDEGRSWTECDNQTCAESLLAARSLRLSVDGGRRSTDNAAIGLALFSVQMSGGSQATYNLLARSGKIVSGIESAFLAEAMALEWALQYLIKLFEGKVAASGKQWLEEPRG